MCSLTSSKLFWHCNGCSKTGTESKTDYDYPKKWVLTTNRGLVCDDCIDEKNDELEIELLDFL